MANDAVREALVRVLADADAQLFTDLLTAMGRTDLLCQDCGRVADALLSRPAEGTGGAVAWEVTRPNSDRFVVWSLEGRDMWTAARGHAVRALYAHPPRPVVTE